MKAGASEFFGRFKVEGLKELDKKLRELEPKIAKKVLRTAVKKAAMPMLHSARANTPVLTGRLVSSLVISTRFSKKYGSYTASIQTKAGAFKGETFYGSFIEFGYHRGKRGHQDRPFIPGQHFMRRAFDENRDSSLSILKHELASGITAAAKEGK
jgi:HK97 gp10 family phage protein